MSPAPRPGSTARGILLILLAILLLSMMDVLAKIASERTNPILTAWARFLGQTVLVALLLAPRMGSVLRSRYPALQALRALFLMTATVCFFFSMTLVGLGSATAVMNTNPVLIALGAALFLGEPFGPRRAAGVVAALAGAMLIIRPGSAVFSPYALLPLVSAVCVAGYGLVTRRVSGTGGDGTWTSLFYATSIGTLVLSAMVGFYWVTPDPLTMLILASLGAIAALGHFCLIRAFTLAEASVVAPFTYSQLVFAMIWGALVFGERPDAMTLAGSAVILCAGLYVWHRETRAASP